MPRIITALFRDVSTAQSALQAMLQSGLARDRIAVIGADHGHEVSSISGFRELSARDDDLAALHDLNLPEDELRGFESALARGGAVISARVEAGDMEQAIQTLEMFDLVDLDDATEARRGQGGGSGGAGAGLRGADTGGPLGAGITGGALAGSSNTAAMPGVGQMAGGASDLGSADLRAGDASLDDMGRSALPASGDRRAEERAGAPGVLEMGRAGGAPMTAGTSSPGVSGGAPARREPRPGSRVRVYATGE
jgi:hypothetical protein